MIPGLPYSWLLFHFHVLFEHLFASVMQPAHPGQQKIPETVFPIRTVFSIQICQCGQLFPAAPIETWSLSWGLRNISIHAPERPIAHTNPYQFSLFQHTPLLCGMSCLHLHVTVLNTRLRSNFYISQSRYLQKSTNWRVKKGRLGLSPGQKGAW